MDLDLIFLGTGGSVPSARRNTASVLVRRGGDRLLFDCGEGTQRQMQRSTGLVQATDIFITHLHADHYLGLPGLIKTWDMQDRDEPLIIYGPPGLRDLFASISRIIGRVGYEIELDELEPGDRVNFDGYTVEPFAVEHRIAANGYLLWRAAAPRPLRPRSRALARRRRGPRLRPPAERRGGRGQGGAGATGAGDESEQRPGRRLAFTGDTRAVRDPAEAAAGAELLIHDASFADAEVERAAETGHSTARQAAATRGRCRCQDAGAGSHLRAPLRPRDPRRGA